MLLNGREINTFFHFQNVRCSHCRDKQRRYEGTNKRKGDSPDIISHISTNISLCLWIRDSHVPHVHHAYHYPRLLYLEHVSSKVKFD
jgi:hypothetical protein